MARPRKIKIIKIIIIIFTLAEANLTNDIPESIEECIARQLRDGMHIFDGDEDGTSWTSDEQDVYDAMEAIADDPTGANHAEGLEGLSNELATALARL